MSVCMCKMATEAVSIWKTLFMPLVCAVPTKKAHQMLVTLLERHQS